MCRWPLHLQQTVLAILLQECFAGLFSPGVSTSHLQFQLLQLLHLHRQVPPNGHQTLQIIQTWVVLTILLRKRQKRHSKTTQPP